MDYTITYQNTGDATLHNVTIVDDPDETYIDGISDISDSGSYDGDTITWNVGDLNPGENGSVTYAATLKGPGHFPPGTTNVDNTATVNSDETEPVTDDARVTVTTEASLTIGKSASPTSASPGDTVDYTITYENTGTATLHNITIVDDPDETYIDGISDISDGGTYDGDTITWNIGTLDPGDNGSVTYTATLKGPGHFPPGTTNVDNTATVNSDETEPVTDDARVTVTTEATLTISKSASPTSADPGDTIDYTISYENTGDATLHNVTIVDDPDETYIDSISDISDGGNYDGDIITWDLGTLDPGDNGSVTYRATLEGSSYFDPGTTTNVDNTAVIDSDETDPVTDDARVTVSRPAPPRDRGGDEGEPDCYFRIDMLGEITKVRFNCSNGKVDRHYLATDPDDKHFVEIESGTIVNYIRADRLNGSPPEVLVMTIAEDVPSAPRGRVIVGPAYDFIGYTRSAKACTSVLFHRTVGVGLEYDPDDLPEGASSIVIAYYDEEEDDWVDAPDMGGVAEIGKANALVRHFSTLAVMATVAPPSSSPSPPPAPAPAPSPAHFVANDLNIVTSQEKMWDPITFITKTGESVTITASIANDGGEQGTYLVELKINGETVDTREVTLSEGQSQLVDFALSVGRSGRYEVELSGLEGEFIVSRAIHWWLFIVAGLTLAIILVTGRLISNTRRRRKVA